MTATPMTLQSTCLHPLVMNLACIRPLRAPLPQCLQSSTLKPLPDITGQRRHKKADVNRRRLRPRVAMAWNTDGDSEEAWKKLQEDATEDQTTLQNLIG